MPRKAITSTKSLFAAAQPLAGQTADRCRRVCARRAIARRWLPNQEIRPASDRPLQFSTFEESTAGAAPVGWVIHYPARVMMSETAEVRKAARRVAAARRSDGDRTTRRKRAWFIRIVDSPVT